MTQINHIISKAFLNFWVKNSTYDSFKQAYCNDAPKNTKIKTSGRSNKYGIQSVYAVTL